MSSESALDRRQDDPRLERIEKQLERLAGETGRIRTALGDRNTTLMFDLDARYMPREEMRTVYVPRTEHTQNATATRDWRRQWPLILLATAGWASNVTLGVLLLLHH